MGQFLFSHRRRCLAAGILGVLCLFTGRMASAGDRVEFRLLRDVTVRLTNGSGVRGKLKSISEQDVVVLMKDDEDKVIPIENVRTLQTNDSSFKYTPASGEFEKLVARVPKIQGATIQRDPAGAATEGEESTASKSTGEGPGGPPAVFARMSGFGKPPSSSKVASSGGIIAVDGFAGANLGPQEKVKLDTTAVATLMHKAAAASGAAEAATRPAAPKGPLVGKPGETVLCANPKCGKPVLSARYGEKCPHCGVTWVQEAAADVIAKGGSSGGVQPVGGNPFGNGSSNNSAQAGQAASVTPTSPTVAAPQSFNLEAVPWWGKAAGFAGLLAVLWFVSQRR